MPSDALRLGDGVRLVRLAGEVGEIPVGLAARADHAMTQLCRLVGARLVAGVELVTGGGPRAVGINAARAHVVGMDEAEVLAQSEQFVQVPDDHNPFRGPLLGSSRTMLTFRRQQVLDDAAWYRGSYFNERCRPFRSDSVVLSRLIRTDLGLDVTLAVCRDVGDRQFGAREQRVVEVFQAEIMPRVFARPAAVVAPPVVPLPALAPRLRPVLQRLLAGDAEKQVATRLSLSRHTVHQYVKVLYRELGVCSRSELLAKCLAPDARPADVPV